MPRWITLGLVVLAVAALLPVACIARARSIRGPVPRLNLVPDMDNQPRFKAQQANPLFADRRSERPAPEGTVPVGGLAEDDHLHRGRVGGEWADTFPFPVTAKVLARGQERYGIYCSPCHGLAGYGDGIVSVRADALQEGTWALPSNFHADPVTSRPVGHIFNTISNGIRNMPAYGPQIPVADRWAIVSYVKALQRSQHAAAADVPESVRPQLR